MIILFYVMNNHDVDTAIFSKCFHVVYTTVLLNQSKFTSAVESQQINKDGYSLLFYENLQKLKIFSAQTGGNREIEYPKPRFAESFFVKQKFLDSDHVKSSKKYYILLYQYNKTLK